MKTRWLLLLSVLAACSRPEANAPAPATPSARVLKVGLLTPGSVNDSGWNAIAYDGLKRIERELEAEVSHQVTKTPAEFEEGFRSGRVRAPEWLGRR